MAHQYVQFRDENSSHSSIILELWIHMLMQCWRQKGGIHAIKLPQNVICTNNYFLLEYFIFFILAMICFKKWKIRLAFIQIWRMVGAGSKTFLLLW